MDCCLSWIRARDDGSSPHWLCIARTSDASWWNRLGVTNELRRWAADAQGLRGGLVSARWPLSWAAQAVGQDWFDLTAVVPLLVVARARAGSGSRRRALGFSLAPILLTFGALTAATVAFLVLFMRNRGVPASRGAAAAMGGIALLNVAALAQLLRHLRTHPLDNVETSCPKSRQANADG